jgi:hypothetical protein
LEVLTCDGAECSRSIFNSQEAVRKGYYGRILGVSGHEVPSLSTVKKWCKWFVKGKITLEDDSRSERPPLGNLCESLRNTLDFMQTHVSEAVDPEDNMLARFA